MINEHNQPNQHLTTPTQPPTAESKLLYLNEFLENSFGKQTRINKKDEPRILRLDGQDFVFLHLLVGGGSFELFDEEFEVEPRSVFALVRIEGSEESDITLTTTLRPYDEPRHHMVARTKEPINWTSDYTFKVDWEVGGHCATGIEKKVTTSRQAMVRQ
jgi:hypothetical protein